MPYYERPIFPVVNERMSILHLYDLSYGPNGFNHTNRTSEWRYDPTDPYAVSVTIHNDETETSATWDFDRDLPTRGLEYGVGKGDVHFMPLDAPFTQPGGRLTSMRLSSPDGMAVFLVPRIPLMRFLRQTYKCVPAGKEGKIVQWFLGVELMMLFNNPDNLAN